MTDGLKPKVEPATQLMGPLHDAVEHAIELIDCAYYASRGQDKPDDELGDAIRRALDDGIKLLRDVREKLHDMVTWAE